MAMIELQKLHINQGMKFLEVQLMTGGIIDPRSGFRKPIDQALREGLISKYIKEEIESEPDELKFKIEGQYSSQKRVFNAWNSSYDMLCSVNLLKVL